MQKGGDYSVLKKEVARLLQDVPNHCLPLFKFRELFETRYQRPINSCDLYKIMDVVFISDTSGKVFQNNCTSLNYFSNKGRMISLHPNWIDKDNGPSVYCKIHSSVNLQRKKGQNGWAEQTFGDCLPNILIDLKILTSRVHCMLESHDGCLSLLSFLDCYESEFELIEKAEDENQGVPLEHILSCVQGVEIGYDKNMIKVVRWKIDKPGEYFELSPMVFQLSRDLVELLKSKQRCTIHFSRIIPAYHHYFGRQCRLSDYGNFNLASLLHAMPNTLQILGEGNYRKVTLTHRAQIKRFISDSFKIIRAKGGLKKQINLDLFNSLFSEIFNGKIFSPEDYGVCYLKDLVQEVVENHNCLTLINENESLFLAITKREQNNLQVQKTKIFSAEVVNLLRHSIRGEISFSKFIPSYHHHFGRQCKVSEYGFSKLAELIDALQDVVYIVNPTDDPDYPQEDRLIRLTPEEQIRVIGDQIWNLVERRNKETAVVTKDVLEEYFLDDYGFHLDPSLCNAEDLDDLLINKLSSYFWLEDEEIKLKDRPGNIKNIEEPIECREFDKIKNRRRHFSKPFPIQNQVVGGNNRISKLQQSNCIQPHQQPQYQPWGKPINNNMCIPIPEFSSPPLIKPPTMNYIEDGRNSFEYERNRCRTPNPNNLVFDLNKGTQIAHPPLNSPPISPPVFWTSFSGPPGTFYYHQPPPTPPINNLIIPPPPSTHFTFNGAWNPTPLGPPQYFNGRLPIHPAQASAQ